MPLHRLLVPVLGLLLLGPGCGGSSGGGSGSATEPSGFLTINVPADILKTGTTQPFTATMAKGGASQAVTPTWRTDNPTVASISTSGESTAIAHGEVTVMADYQGMSDTKKIRVVNDYGAPWYGNYLVAGCRSTGAFDDWCDSDPFAAGNTAATTAIPSRTWTTSC